MTDERLAGIAAYYTDDTVEHRAVRELTDALVAERAEVERLKQFIETTGNAEEYREWRHR